MNVPVYLPEPAPLLHRGRPGSTIRGIRGSTMRPILRTFVLTAFSSEGLPTDQIEVRAGTVEEAKRIASSRNPRLRWEVRP